MDRIEVNFDEFRHYINDIRKLTDNYYEYCFEMRSIVSSVLSCAPDLYDTSYELYREMNIEYERLAELCTGSARIADNYEYTENSILRKAARLSEEEPDFNSLNTTGAVSTALLYTAGSGKGIFSAYTPDVFMPSLMISSDIQHEEWLIKKYIEKHLKKEDKK